MSMLLARPSIPYRLRDRAVSLMRSAIARDPQIVRAQLIGFLPLLLAGELDVCRVELTG